MRPSRRDIIRSCFLRGALAAFGTVPPSAAARRIRVGIGRKSIEPSVISIRVGEGLGYAQDLGIALDRLALGSLSKVLIALDKGDLDFGVVAPAFSLPVFEGELPPVVAFYEYAYPTDGTSRCGNELIHEINDFDRARVIAEARAVKI